MCGEKIFAIDRSVPEIWVEYQKKCQKAFDSKIAKVHFRVKEAFSGEDFVLVGLEIMQGSL